MVNEDSSSISNKSIEAAYADAPGSSEEVEKHREEDMYQIKSAKFKNGKE